MAVGINTRGAASSAGLTSQQREALLKRAQGELQGAKDFYLQMGRVNQGRKMSVADMQMAKKDFEAFERAASQVLEREARRLSVLRKQKGAESAEFGISFGRLCLAKYLVEELGKMFASWEKGGSLSHYSLFQNIQNSVREMLTGNLYFAAGSAESMAVETRRAYIDLKPQFEACAELCGVPFLDTLISITKSYELRRDTSDDRLLIDRKRAL